MMCVRFIALGILAIGLAAPLGAQRAGVVLDPAGQPLPDVTVVFWGTAQELARTSTDSAGRFRFTADQSTGATTVLARRIGLQPGSMDVSRSGTELRLVLEPIAAPLPAVTATAVQRACPGAEQPEARALWRSVADRYASAPPDRGHGTVMLRREGEVSGAEIAEIDEDHLRDHWRAVHGDVRRRWARFIPDSGYAGRTPEYRSGFEPREETSLYWRYAPLHREMVEHFVSQEFSLRQLFRLWRHSDGSATLAFCRGRRAPGPAIEGTLELAPDSSIASVSWRYLTPRPDEDAGGHVSFVPPPGVARFRRLIPARSVFWRRLAGYEDLYYQDAAVYRTWRYGLDSQVPRQRPDEQFGARAAGHR